MGPETTHRAPTSTSPNRFHSGGSVPPATQEEGITFHPLLTGTSEALRKLWDQLRQPGDTPGLRLEVTFGAAALSGQRWSFKSN